MILGPPILREFEQVRARLRDSRLPYGLVADAADLSERTVRYVANTVEGRSVRLDTVARIDAALDRLTTPVAPHDTTPAEGEAA